MKIMTLMAFMIFSLTAIAQPVIKKTGPVSTKFPSSSVPVADKIKKKDEKGSGTLAGRNMTTIPAKSYMQLSNHVNLGAMLATRTIMVDGRKISARMLATDDMSLARPMPKKTGITQKITPKQKNDGADVVCQTYSVKVSAASESFDVPYGTQASHIYPGAAYQYDEYYKNTVSPKAITLERNPIYIQVASSSGSGQYKLVDNPTSITLNAAAGALKAALPPAPTNESTSINMVSLYDESDFFLKVNGGGGGFGFKADASFGIANSTKKSYFLIDATQTFYTLNAVMPEGAQNTSFFKDAANDQSNGALFMASVSYGRRVLGIVETEFKSEKMEADFKASYSGGFASGYAGLGMMNGMVSQNTKVKLYFVGGNATSIEVPNATEASVLSVINNYMRNTTAQNATPIKFTFRNMNMSGMRYESATDNFTYEQCVPVNPTLKYAVTVQLTGIDNSKNEEVKFGVKQMANVYTWDKIIVRPGELPGTPFLTWMETNEPFKSLWKAEQPRNFTKTTQVNREMQYTMTQAEILDGSARVELITDYIAMYATKIAGKTNDTNPKKKEVVLIKDVINSSGGQLSKSVDINFNGRVFTMRWRIVAVPVSQ